MDEMRNLVADLPAESRHEVERLSAMAMAYVWGRQDAQPSERHTGRSVEFGRAYGLHAARYAAQVIGYRRDIQSAWNRWSIGDGIEDTAPVSA